MLAICSPAMLNALLGDMQVTACRRELFPARRQKEYRHVPGRSVRNVFRRTPPSRCGGGRCSPICISSSLVHTRPAGLWGLQSSITFTRSDRRLSVSKSSIIDAVGMVGS